MLMLIVGSLILGATEPESAAPRPCVIVVVGAPGTSEYESEFRQTADLWASICSRAPADLIRIGGAAESGATTDRDRLRPELARQATRAETPLWLILIGHGTFDRRHARFNLAGPDVTEAELAEWLTPVTRPLVVVNGGSSSGPFLGMLSGPGRVVITATRSGGEHNFTRFGRYFAEALAGTDGDLDKDGQVSLLEAFLKGGRDVEEFYRSKSRLATEHALLDDNGDRLGTQVDWFRGIRAIKQARDGAELDGTRAHRFSLIRGGAEQALSPDQLARRDQLELELEELRAAKGTLREDDYYARLEPILVELARIGREATESQVAPPAP